MRVECFVDSFARGEKDGLPVLRVDDLEARPELFVVVASVYFPEIEGELENRGVRDFRVLHPEVNPGQCFWGEEREELAGELAGAEAVFAEAGDRELFRRLVDLRTVGMGRMQDLAGEGAGDCGRGKAFIQVGSVPGREGEGQAGQSFVGVAASGSGGGSPGSLAGSEGAGVSPWPPGGRIYLDFLPDVRFGTVVEGGVYDGTNSLDFLERLEPDGRLYAFEPFPRFVREGPHAARLSGDPRFVLVPGGLWESGGEALFQVDGEASRVDAGTGAGSREAGRGDSPGEGGCEEAGGRSGESPEPAAGPGQVRVALHGLDGFVRERGLTGLDLLKLDVENAELPVLRGAAETLARFRPFLAVCLYHSKFDLFQIPLHLARTLPGYRFRLGHYSPGLFDTVLYGMPEERLSRGVPPMRGEKSEE
jgi:FkbM family methyltransferase